MFGFFKNSRDILNFDTFYLTYDEPDKENRWLMIKKVLPNAHRVDGIKGFDKAHKYCAKLSSTSRLTIIDGDNSFIENTAPRLEIDKKLLKKNYIFSYSSINSINGLIYGNGGIKCWPKDLLLETNSHESSHEKESAVDFCFTVPYYQMPHTPTISNVNITSFQAFRAGYREGVKMSLQKGLPLDLKKDTNLDQILYRGNLFRLKTWCEIGRDITNGIWAIYGARLGLFEILCNPQILDHIRDYDWFSEKWNTVAKFNPEKEALSMAKKLDHQFNFSLTEYDSHESKHFKNSMINPHREGLMFPEMNE